MLFLKSLHKNSHKALSQRQQFKKCLDHTEGIKLTNFRMRMEGQASVGILSGDGSIGRCHCSLVELFSPSRPHIGGHKICHPPLTWLTLFALSQPTCSPGLSLFQQLQTLHTISSQPQPIPQSLLNTPKFHTSGD